MRLRPRLLAPALALAGGCLDAETHRADAPAGPDTLHLVAALRSEARTQIDAVEQRIERLQALQAGTYRAGGGSIAVRLDSIERQIAAIEYRVAAIGFHDSSRWRAATHEVDSAFVALWADVARAELRARQLP